MEFLENAVRMPLLALRGLVVFPKTVASFDVARTKSANALAAAMETDRNLFVVTQKNIHAEDPERSDLYDIGCVVLVKQVLKVSDNLVKVIVEGKYRASYMNFKNGKHFCVADVVKADIKPAPNREVYKETLVRKIRERFHRFVSLLPGIAPDIPKTVDSITDLDFLCDFIAYNIPAPFDDKQFILEQLSVSKKAKLLLQLLDKEREIGELDRKISEKTRAAIDDNQREYYLREQLKVINGELYGDDSADEIDLYYSKVESLNAPENVKEILRGHVSKLSKMPQGSHEGTVERGYLDICLELPWQIYSKTQVDVSKAAKILDRDIYGMKDVKERILELLAVFALTPDIKGQIICLAGPPGVGKTSIGRSIAECMGRKYARVSLGGIHDEAEIRGHRKTYIGSMPGKIITAIKNAGTNNPLILLDEIDKLASDYKGDPASALLEVLDPEQNNTFVDHFIEIPFDLSRAVFIATANNVESIPAPLLDRMELIELTSYTREEKFNIAKRHLVSKQLAVYGLKKSQVKIEDDALYALIDFYTREAGVRKLERTIASLCRKAAKMIASGEKSRVVIKNNNLEVLLGKHKYKAEIILKNDEVGTINGLAWTSVGGTIMQLEVSVMEGSGKIELTGSLGEVMQESAKAAVSYVRANAEKYNISTDFYKTKDIHIHATEAATKKDGPSAGVTITTALISALTNRPIRRDVAMTGEVSIRGRVLAIGGLKEKSMAAYSAGVNKVFIPNDNLPDLDEVDPVVKDKVEFIAVSNVEEIIEQALLKAEDTNCGKWNIDSSVVGQKSHTVTLR